MTDDTFTPAELALAALRLRTSFALGLAEMEETLAEKTRSAPAPLRETRFELMAARSGGASLPLDPVPDDDLGLQVGFALDATGIAVTVEALGADRAEDLAGVTGWMSTVNGIVSYRFTFDNAGVAAFRLSRDPAVIESLAAAFTIHLPEEKA